MLTSRVTNRLDIPGEDGAWVEIRKLPGRKLREASEAHLQQAYRQVGLLGKDGIEAVRAVTPAQIESARSNPSAKYDRGVLLRAAVIAWSYSEKPTPDELDDLDGATEDWLVDQVVTLSNPPRDEVAAKNG